MPNPQGSPCFLAPRSPVVLDLTSMSLHFPTMNQATMAARLPVSLLSLSFLCGVVHHTASEAAAAFLPGASHRLQDTVGPRYSSKRSPVWMSAATGGGNDKPGKNIDKRWQKKRRRVALGEDGLPVEPVYAPRQMKKWVHTHDINSHTPLTSLWRMHGITFREIATVGRSGRVGPLSG